MRRKALAYITRKNAAEILVFRHEHFPEAGLQVPGGSVEGKEDVVRALWREVKEESGLSQLELISQIAQEPYYNSFKSEWQERHVFHLRAPDHLPDQWIHIVSDGEEDKGLHFVFFWLSLAEAATVLVCNQGDWIKRLTPI